MSFAPKPQPIQFGDRKIGAGQPALVIAEIGSNHNLNFSRAEKLIEAAAHAGADVVKFQSLILGKQWHETAHSPEMKALYDEITLPEEWYDSLAKICNREGVGFLCSPTYDEAVDLLLRVNVPGFKIASVQSYGDHDLIRYAAKTGKAVILSTGLAGTDRMLKAVEAARSTGNNNVAVLHCVARYPTKVSELNLRRIPYLEAVLGVPVGFSDHTMSETAAALAVAQGACIIEKHITLDRTLRGPDHAFAAEPPDFEKMVKNIRDAESALGDAYSRPDGQAEEGFRRATEVKIVLRRDLPVGSVVTPKDCDRLRAPKGIGLEQFAALASPKLLVAKKKGEVLHWADVRFEEA